MFVVPLLLQAAPIASAPLSPERADARCLAAFGMLANEADPKVQRAGQLGAVYFYGKLLGRNPELDLKAAVLAATRAIGPEASAELTRCGGELDRAGAAMQAAGAAITAGTPSPRTPAPSATPTPPPAHRR